MNTKNISLKFHINLVENNNYDKGGTRMCIRGWWWVPSPTNKTLKISDVWSFSYILGNGFSQ